MFEILAQTTQPAKVEWVVVIQSLVPLLYVLVGGCVTYYFGVKRGRKVREEERKVLLPGLLLGQVVELRIRLTSHVRLKQMVSYYRKLGLM
jgi:hypothetical protein